MPQIGPLELLTLAAVALIVFGPHRLPEIARTIGRTLSELRRQANEIRGEFATSFDESSQGDATPERSEPAAAHGTEIEREMSRAEADRPSTDWES
ncbi:MAG: twin-arginine translocase TatA/TatE family subunit [Actinomycetota bacterium]|nr:twin-arginine translocase TatA/TatE family subunit [Actinomycetota bacterium]